MSKPPLVPQDGAAQLPDGIVGDLLAYGRDESNQARIAKDRDMYQFYQGWCSALERVKAIPPDDAAAALKALVERWREDGLLEHKLAMARPAHSKDRIALLHSGDGKLICAHELEIALAALPEARRQEPLQTLKRLHAAWTRALYRLGDWRDKQGYSTEAASELDAEVRKALQAEARRQEDEK